jgi:hypothetical protein
MHSQKKIRIESMHRDIISEKTERLKFIFNCQHDT